MSRQNEVISFDLAQALHAAGVPQCSDLSYNPSGHLGYFANVNPHDAAFTLSEIFPLLTGERVHLIVEDGTAACSIRARKLVILGESTPQEAIGRLLLQVWRGREAS
jgi:hypothetical protein